MTATTTTTERERHVSAFYQQCRIIGVLMVQELHGRFGKYHLGLVWLLAEPLIYATFFALFREYLGRLVPIGTSMELFVFTGLMPYLLVRNLSVKVMRAFDVDDTARMQPVVTYFDVIISRAMLEIVLFMAAVVVWMSALGLMNLQWYPDDPADFVGAFAALTLLGVGGGVFNAIVANYLPLWRRVLPWILRICFITSGAIFLLTRFPYYVMAYLWWNPLFHGVEWIRSAFYGEFHSWVLDRTYLLFFGGMLLLAGLILERSLRRKPMYE